MSRNRERVSYTSFKKFDYILHSTARLEIDFRASGDARTFFYSLKRMPKLNKCKALTAKNSYHHLGVWWYYLDTISSDRFFFDD